MKLTRVGVFDLAKAFAATYALLTLVSIVVIIFGHFNEAMSPFGLYLGPLHFSVDWTVKDIHDHAGTMAMAIFLQVLGWTVTGGISGGVLGLAFNFVGKDLLSIEVATEKVPTSDPFDI